MNQRLLKTLTTRTLEKSETPYSVSSGENRNQGFLDML